MGIEQNARLNSPNRAAADFDTNYSSPAVRPAKTIILINEIV
jgi:hypothetical protein